MRLDELRHDVGRVLRGGIVVLGLVALAGPSALSRDGEGDSDEKAGASHSAALRGEATGGLGLTSEPSRAAATGTDGLGAPGGSGAGTARRGEGAFAMSPTDVTESFGSLTKQQQARVMQRCKDVIAKPGEADPNQLALCQTLAAMVRR
jgi:hypothetical protein